MPAIALVTKMSDEQRRIVQDLCGGRAELLDFSSDRDGLAQRGGAVEIVWGRVKPEELQRLPKLRWVHANWTGIENMLYPELIARQVILTNTRGQNANAMAEHIVGSVLYLARDFPAFYRASQARVWKAETKIVRVAGSKALILGAGTIAKVLAPKLAGLGVQLCGVNSTGQPAHGVTEMYTLETVRPCLAKIDWLISLMPATTHTHKCINESFLRALKPGAGVINLSRGAVLDDAALLACLNDGHLCGAVLDVTDPEPPPENSPLYGHPKIVLTGHQSPRPFDETGVAFEVFTHNLPCYLRGDLSAMRNRVDYAKGY